MRRPGRGRLPHASREYLVRLVARERDAARALKPQAYHDAVAAGSVRGGSAGAVEAPRLDRERVYVGGLAPERLGRPRPLRRRLSG